jgi:hypothetical protein
MLAQLELEMLGGAATARLRRRRPGAIDLPWGTLDRSRFSDRALDEARAVWTNGVFTEYASAAAFAAMATAFLECGAPLDLTAAAADIVVDEIDHAEVLSGLVMELGGPVRYEADLALVSPATTPDVPPMVRAAELSIKTSCVGEALSVPALGRSREGVDCPLVRAVLERLLRDEGAHARVGAWFLEWSADRLASGDREHLATVALDAIGAYRPLWQGGCRACEPTPELGAVPVLDHAELLVRTVRTRIAPRLEALGIPIAGARLEALLS